MSRAAAAAAALALLHLLTAWQFPWEAPAGGLAWLRPSPDLVLLLAVATTVALAGGSRRLLAHGLALGCLFVPLWRCAWSAMPRFFGKELEPFDDVSLLAALPHLLLHDRPLLVQVLVGAGVLLGVLAVYLLVLWAAATLLRAVSTPAAGLALLVLAQVLVVARWIEASALAPERASRILQPGMLGDALGRAATLVKKRGWRTELLFADRAAAARAEHASLPHDLGRLRDTDVYVLFVESYGRVALRSATRTEFEARLHAAEQRLQAAGFGACSAFTRPAVRGGQSSLAHAELNCGVPVESRRIFDRLLTSDLPALPKAFAAAGHFTVNVQPAMPRAWPEGAAFFGFERDVFQDAFHYQGRQYPWGNVPDQFALEHVLRTIVVPSPRPLFVQYVSVSSHAPFSSVPPYFEDWRQVADPGAYAGEPAKDFAIPWTMYARHPRLPEAYFESIDYGLRTMFGFACQLTRPSLLLVLGDHQPPIAELVECDPSRDVPIHVLANDDALLAPFLAQGFRPGLVPGDEQVAFSSSRLLFRILRDYSGR